MATNRIKAALDSKVSNDAQPRYKRLEGDAKGAPKTGDFVHETQKMGTEAGFKNVSLLWVNKCHSFDWAFDQIGADHRVTKDVRIDLSKVGASVNHDGTAVVLNFADLGDYKPTEFAWQKIATMLGLNTQFFNYALDSWSVSAGRGGPRGSNRADFHPERIDYEFVSNILNRRIDRIRNSVASEKEYLFRLNDRDKSVRVMMTSEYVCIDNRWYLEVLRDLIPDGLVSHWRGDEDNMYGNILIPDSIREDVDSDYGGMIGLGNSEIGFRSLTCQPSIFRAICMNGCVHGQVQGENIKQVHRGDDIKNNLMKLRSEIVTCVNDQIPLLGQGIDTLLNTKGMRWDGAVAKPYVMQASKDFGLTKPEGNRVLASYRTEVNECPANKNTLFGLVNGVTRAAQDFKDAVSWERLNKIGGRMIDMDTDDWGTFVKRANKLSAKDVDTFFAVAAN